MLSTPCLQAAPLTGLHILLVEDDADVREATQSLLEEEGARVTSLSAAAPALARIMSSGADFDILLTDVVLGDTLCGFDLAAAALARCPPLRVLLVTGYAGPAGSVPLGLTEAVPLLLKPFRRAELLVALAAVQDPAGIHERAVA